MLGCDFNLRGHRGQKRPPCAPTSPWHLHDPTAESPGGLRRIGFPRRT